MQSATILKIAFNPVEHEQLESGDRCLFPVPLVLPTSGPRVDQFQMSIEVQARASHFTFPFERSERRHPLSK